MNQKISKRFKAQLERYRDSNDYYDWRESLQFAQELLDLLNQLKKLTDPKVALELLTLFLEADQTLYELCDDSHGDVSISYDVAYDLLVSWAQRCDDEAFVRSIFTRLFAHPHDYSLIEHLEAAALQVYSPEEVQALRQARCDEV